MGMDMRSKPPKLMDRVKATMRVKRYSHRTEKTYCYWIRFFIAMCWSNLWVRLASSRTPGVHADCRSFGLNPAAAGF
ncbi:phage integrase N-terminal SAM-like domain-containing protein [Kushneria aurantia]|uniref:Phage integrase N-terminal SAM-like domain-containing protein n=1 Tax=Kushneria aurantia TaxID=504092 RepID=A0ABV6G717_9GAMM